MTLCGAAVPIVEIKWGSSAQIWEVTGPLVLALKVDRAMRLVQMGQSLDSTNNSDNGDQGLWGFGEKCGA
jgi:hypothetical protein